VLLTHNLIYTNTATEGAGVFSTNSLSTTIVDSAIYTNTAGQEWRGGGILLRGSARAVVSGNRLSGNQGGYYGGAVYAFASDYVSITHNHVFSNSAIVEGGSFEIEESDNAYVGFNDITDNRAVGGGGLSLRGSYNPTIDSNNIHKNSGLTAAGMYVDSSPDALIVNNMIWKNTVNDAGKAPAIQIYSSDFVTPCHATILHNTIISNTGAGSAAIHIQLEEPSTVVISNTIIVSQSVGVTITAGNTAVMEGILWGSGHWQTAQVWGGEGTVITGSINIYEDPGFLDASADDYHLAPGSAAIDAGSPTWLWYDFDGGLRPVGAGPDIGADELDSLTSYLPLVMRSFAGSSSQDGLASRYPPWPAGTW
jgi:hypothetical protein